MAGNNGPLGLVGDTVTALIPFSDDVLIFGMDSSITLLNGDPLDGGKLDPVTDAIGIAWGDAWCRDPYGTIFFMSSFGSIFRMMPGEKPLRVSQPIERLVHGIRLNECSVSMQWDDRFQGFSVFVTPFAAAGPTTHYFFEARAGAWWPVQFANDDFNPLCCWEFNGNSFGDSVALFGSWDGYVRSFSSSATNDDGVDIESVVMVGPILTKDFDAVMCHNLQTILSETSGTVAWEIRVGATAEEAVNNDAQVSGVWEAGRNLQDQVRANGHAIWLRLSSSSPWALEAVRMQIQSLGKVQRRGA